MPDEHRRTKARDAANEYAPKPDGSSLTYGFVGVSLAGLAMIFFDMFYDANIIAHPVIIAVLLAAVFLGGVILRKRRKRLHVAAFKDEYERHNNSHPGKSH